jgi:ribose transport system permease protein
MDSLAVNTRKTLLYAAIALVCIAVIVVLFNRITGGTFLTVANINALCISAALTSFTAWGYCFIFALNYMDLSVGAAIVVCIFAAGEFGNRFGYPGVILGGIIVGVILMSVNFNVFAWTRIPSWVAGLGMCLIYEAIASYYTAIKQSSGEITVLLKDEYRGLGFAPGIYVVFALAFFFSYFIYNRTSVGLNVRAIGSNPIVAKAMGINIPVTLVLTGIVCGILIGCAGFVRESYMGRIFALTGLTSLASIFQPLATVLLAQVLSRRINIIIAVPFCALFIFIWFNALTIVGVPSGTLQEAVLGLCVVIFGVIAQKGTKEMVK